MSIKKLLIAAAFIVVAAPSLGSASGGAALPHQEWGHKGIFGTFDRAALKRGARVAVDVCMGCHSFKYIKFEHLSALGFGEAEIKQLAADQGKTKNERLISALDNATALDSYNIIPPDLSLMTKARVGFEDYTYGVLNGYVSDEAAEVISDALDDENLTNDELKKVAEAMHLDPSDLEHVRTLAQRVNDGDNYNRYFPGNFFAMPPPLSEDAVEYEDGTPATLHQLSHDVVTFMSWAAEPHMEESKSLGLKVLAYLAILTLLLFALKKRIWARMH